PRLETKQMTMPHKTLAAALVAAAIPLAAPAKAAPLSQSLALNSADLGTTEHVQYRRWHRRGYRSGHRAYAWSPGYSRPRAWNYGNGSAATTRGTRVRCPADREVASGYPSWMCR